MSPDSPYAPFTKHLSHKLNRRQVLFFTGAGLSASWRGMLGGSLSRLMVETFLQAEMLDGDPRLKQIRRWVKGWRPPFQGGFYEQLPVVSELLGQNKCWYIRQFMVPDAVGRDRPPLSPSLKEIVRTDPVAAGHIGIPHITLARLAKEGLLTEIITTNVDMLHEAGCEAVGLRRPESEEDPALQFPWVEAYRTVTDRREHARTMPGRKMLTIYKIHGCLDAARAAVRAQAPHECSWNERHPECEKLAQKNHNFVFTYRELLNWRTDHWAHDLLADRARSCHIVFAGFAVADAVAHSLFRDIYDELHAAESGNGTRLAPLLGSQPEKPAAKQELRAQMITKEKSLQAAAVMASANRADPLADGEQWAEVKGREESEELFRDLYNRTIVELLTHQLENRGHSVIERWIGLARRTAVTQEHCEKLEAFLAALRDQAPDFLYHTLPGAVRLSWLATDPVLGTGSREPDRRFNPYESRYTSPHYYVPLSKQMETTLLLLRAYQVLLGGEVPASGEAQFLPGGWVRFSGWTGAAVAVLPILSPMEANISLLRRVRASAPPMRTAPMLLHILRTGEVAPEQSADQCDELLDPLGLSAMQSLATWRVSRPRLWDPEPDLTGEIRSHIAAELEGKGMA